MNKDPSLVDRTRGKAAALIEGVLSRQTVLYALSEEEASPGLAIGRPIHHSQLHRRRGSIGRGAGLGHSPSLGAAGSHSTPANQDKADPAAVEKQNERDSAFRRVENYIEDFTVKSANLWVKVEKQIKEKYLESHPEGDSKKEATVDESKQQEGDLAGSTNLSVGTESKAEPKQEAISETDKMDVDEKPDSRPPTSRIETIGEPTSSPAPPPPRPRLMSPAPPIRSPAPGVHRPSSSLSMDSPSRPSLVRQGSRERSVDRRESRPGTHSSHESVSRRGSVYDDRRSSSGYRDDRDRDRRPERHSVSRERERERDRDRDRDGRRDSYRERPRDRDDWRREEDLRRDRDRSSERRRGRDRDLDRERERDRARRDYDERAPQRRDYDDRRRESRGRGGYDYEYPRRR